MSGEKNFHQIHSKISYVDKVLTADIVLVNHYLGNEMAFKIGEKINVRVEEFDWGMWYTAFDIISEGVYSLTKTAGICPIVNDIEIENIIKNDSK